MNIKNMIENIESILDATEKTIADMPNNSRMQIKDLATTVGLVVAMEPKKVLPFVNYFAHNNDVARVSRGKTGGIIKGTPERITKRNKKATTPSV